jgi:DNA-binding Lrp family transcriptional regulator
LGRRASAASLWPEVASAYVITGASNYVLRVQARNLKHFSDFIVNHLNRTAGVMDIRSEIVLQKIKDRDEVLDLVVRK